MSNSKEFELHVFITHFCPPQVSIAKSILDFIRPRISKEFLRSYARLLKHGTRGNQPWKKDIMTNSRRGRESFRNEYLGEVLFALEQLSVKKLNIYLYSNESFSYEPLSSRTLFTCKVFPKYNKMNAHNNSPWQESDLESPWNLLWENREILKLLARSQVNQKSLYLILENDTPINQVNLDYWLETREELSEEGLIPSFLRSEIENSGERWRFIDVHSLDPDQVNSWKVFPKKGNSFIQIPSLYCGVIILDNKLLQEFVESKAFDRFKSRELTWWDMGARAAMGLQFVNVPKGFSDRYALRLHGGYQEIDPACIIHHLPNLYASVPEVCQTRPTVGWLRNSIGRLKIHD